MRVTSLDQLDSSGRPLAARLVDPGPSPEERALAGIRAEIITESIAQLKPRGRAIVSILYGLDRDQRGLETVAKELGLSIPDARAERDYALFQLEHLVKTHRHGAFLMAA